MRIPLRLLVAGAMALLLIFLLTLYLSKTFTGRAIKAVAQDEEALTLMRSRQDKQGIRHRHGGRLDRRSASYHRGAVDPSLDRLYIGRTFCVVVLGGLGSMTGKPIAGLILASLNRLCSRSLVLPGFQLRSVCFWLCGHPATLFGR